MPRSAVLLLTLALCAGCARPPPPSPPAAPPAPAAPATPTAADVLDRLDARTAVPLLPMMANHQKQNMRDHLVAVQEIVSAAAADDFAAVEKAVGRIGFSDQMGAMCNHMGAGAPGFSAQAVAFHHTADRIAEAARARDRKAVLAALSATLQACTTCHASWKQRVADEPTWTQLTSSAPPTGHPPGH